MTQRPTKLQPHPWNDSPSEDKQLCVLHVGMPKTGSSSIQSTLFFGLDNTGHRYIGFGEINGSRALKTLLGENPEQFFLHRFLNFDKKVTERLKARFQQRLTKSLRLSRRERAIPILSAEGCWSMNRSELESLRKLIDNHGYEVRVIVYLRPIKAWLESVFQERVKWGMQDFTALIQQQTARNSRSNYRERLATLEEAFGRDNIFAYPFRSHELADQCVVKDFCLRLGIRMDPTQIRQTNEGMSLDAVRLLYAYNQFGCDKDPGNIKELLLLHRTLQDLQGESLRFHSQAIKPIAPFIGKQQELISQHYGIDLSEDLSAYDDRACIRDEADLFRFSRASLDWLARASGSSPIHGSEGEDVARQVSDQMRRLRRHSPWRNRLALYKDIARREIRRIRHGV